MSVGARFSFFSQFIHDGVCLKNAYSFKIIFSSLETHIGYVSHIFYGV
jgi:hypothetical protein